MKRSQLILSIVIVLAITVAGGAIHGRLNQRWGASEEAQKAAELLETFPDQFGPWKVANKSDLDEAARDQLRPYGYIGRTFINLDTGENVSFFVLVGPVGRTFVHNPEVCYSSRNFEIIKGKNAAAFDIEGRAQDQLWSMTFRQNSLQGGLLRVYYGWSDGKRWEASSGGRFKYFGLPYLYKIQLATHQPGNADLESNDAFAPFLKDLVPVLEKHMIPTKRRGLASFLWFLRKT